MFRLEGGTEDNDLWVEEATNANGDDLLCSVWVPDEDERRRIAEGENVELSVWGRGHPPVAMTVTPVLLGKPPEHDDQVDI